VNLVRYHGVFAPHHQLRAQIVPAKRDRGRQQQGQGAEGACPRPVSMTWAQRLARVFAIDVTSCERCGGAVKIIPCVKAPLVIRKILDLVQRAARCSLNYRQHEPLPRAPACLTNPVFWHFLEPGWLVSASGPSPPCALCAESSQTAPPKAQ
jgi:hypothetical protein